MKAKHRRPAAALLLLALTGAAMAAVDEEAAKALAKRNDCFKCHAVDKTKKGPSFGRIAAEYRGRADGGEIIMKKFTTGATVKLEDGTEEEHKIIDTKDPKALKNLVDWIRSR